MRRKLLLGGAVCAGVAAIVVGAPSPAKADWVFNYIGSEVTWTAPITGLYDITAAGAAGGVGGLYGDPTLGGGTNSGGAGAIAHASDIALSAGQTLTILVGGVGGADASITGGRFAGHTGGGGGGGSFVVLGSNTPLLIAGGGGGGGAGGAGYPPGIGGGGRGYDAGQGEPGAGGAGGAGYNYFFASGAGGGGGGGFSGNGGSGQNYGAGAGGSSFLNGGAGGLGFGDANGGFGGGGGGGWGENGMGDVFFGYGGGGGGGGYIGANGGDGGSAGAGGMGGTSYVIQDAAQFSWFLPGANGGNGYVDITVPAPAPGAGLLSFAALILMGTAAKASKAFNRFRRS
jgi:hypothetical protein